MWSVMLINKDPKKAWNVIVDVENNATGKTNTLHPTQSVQYSGQQYHWTNKERDGHPSLNLPPVKKMISNGLNVILPAYSLTVLELK
jgi:hypothetical protein